MTDNLEGPAATVGRAAKSLSMVEAERLASIMRLSKEEGAKVGWKTDH
jgi:hypothetical protein